MKGGAGMKISVILTSYNRPQLVREAITSVQDQTYSDWELLVVDDNSGDETRSVLARIEAAEPRCRIIQSNVSPEDRPRTARYATCINLAIPLLSGDLVTYLTDDDIYLPERFEQMHALFVSHPEIFVVYGQQRLVQLMASGQRNFQTLRPMPGITRQPNGVIDHNSVMHRRSCFDVVGYWEDKPELWSFADATFFLKLAGCWEFHPLYQVTDEHRYHDHSIRDRVLAGRPPWEQAEAIQDS